MKIILCDIDHLHKEMNVIINCYYVHVKKTINAMY